MKKVARLLALVCVLNIVALAGLVAFLAATGRLDKAKAEAIADLLKHQGSPEKLRDHVYDILQPTATTGPATNAASQPATGPAEAGPITSEARIEYARQAMELERLQMENERQKLLEEQNRLEGIKAALDEELKEIDTKKKAYDLAIAQSSNKTDDATFQKNMTLYEEMKPRQMKDILIGMDAAEATKYVGAMDPDRVSKIVDEFKTNEEKEFIQGVLGRLRRTGTESASAKLPQSATAPSGTLSAAAPGAKLPAAP